MIILHKLYNDARYLYCLFNTIYERFEKGNPRLVLNDPLKLKLTCGGEGLDLLMTTRFKAKINTFLYFLLYTTNIFLKHKY